VPADGSLQKALDEARGGDWIVLEPRATYRGPFRLPRKTGDQWIVIASAAANLPRAGQRVNPSHGDLMPKLVSSSGPIFHTEAGAHHYRFVGLHLAPTEGSELRTLVQLGSGETTEEALPHHFIFDRSYLRGDPLRGTRRGIEMNSRATAVVDSYLADFKHRRDDSQAVVAWNGAGPFKLANSYLEAAGENVMFGGGDPTVPNLVPSDIEIVGNHLAKPLRWKADQRGFEGVEWAVKNLLEIKNGRRARIDGNLFEYNWPQAQNGFAILLTVRNQDGSAPWSTIEDITFVNNLVRHVGSGFNILGRDDNHSSEQLKRVVIRNNVFADVGGRWGEGRLFQFLNGTHGVSIDHNTACQTGGIVFADSQPHTGFVFQNNIIPHNMYGISGSGTGVGQATLNRYFPNASVRRNVIVGGNADKYPKDNFFPSTLAEVGLEAPCVATAPPRLAPRYRRAGTDGTDLGADVEAVVRAAGSVAVREPTDRLFAADVAAPALDESRWPMAALVLFWMSFAGLCYVYFGYPLLAWMRARRRPASCQRAEIEPFVSVVVVAHNELRADGCPRSPVSSASGQAHGNQCRRSLSAGVHRRLRRRAAAFRA
jgi:hypothetical protein